eukprot:178371-Hanusia_phi.AAC.1
MEPKPNAGCLVAQQINSRARNSIWASSAPIKSKQLCEKVALNRTKNAWRKKTLPAKLKFQFRCAAADMHFCLLVSVEISKRWHERHRSVPWEARGSFNSKGRQTIHSRQDPTPPHLSNECTPSLPLLVSLSMLARGPEIFYDAKHRLPSRLVRYLVCCFSLSSASSCQFAFTAALISAVLRCFGLLLSPSLESRYRRSSLLLACTALFPSLLSSDASLSSALSSARPLLSSTLADMPAAGRPRRVGGEWVYLGGVTDPGVYCRSQGGVVIDL